MRYQLPRLLLTTLVALTAGMLSACKIETSTGVGQCFLGPCAGPVTIPEYNYAVVGLPASRVIDHVAFLPVGEPLTLYFVRYRPFSACGVVDTIRTDATWAITGPFGSPVDSSVATITQMPDGGAVLRARSVGQFGIRYVPNASLKTPMGYVWQSARICPGDFEVLDFRVTG